MSNFSPSLQFSFLGKTITVTNFFEAVARAGYLGPEHDNEIKTQASTVASLLGIGTSLSGKNMVEQFYMKPKWQAWRNTQSDMVFNSSTLISIIQGAIDATTNLATVEEK